MTGERMTDEQWAQLREATKRCNAEIQVFLDAWNAAFVEASNGLKRLSEDMNKALARVDIKPVRFRDRQ